MDRSKFTGRFFFENKNQPLIFNTRIYCMYHTPIMNTSESLDPKLITFLPLNFESFEKMKF